MDTNQQSTLENGAAIGQLMMVLPQFKDKLEASVGGLERFNDALGGVLNKIGSIGSIKTEEKKTPNILESLSSKLGSIGSIKTEEKKTPNILESLSSKLGISSKFSEAMVGVSSLNKTTKEDVFSADVEPIPVMLSGFSSDAIESLTKLLKADAKGGKLADTAGVAAGGGLGSLLGSLFGGGKISLGKLLMDGLKGIFNVGGKLAAFATNPITLILGGIIWGVIDAFRGAKMAEEWGVSKTAGAMGGLLGGMDKGLSGAMKNMGKWALIGAGIGSAAVPIVGTVLGGIIGAIVGAILGWIGGERIAKAFQAVGDWFSQRWDEFVGFLKKIPEFINNINVYLSDKISNFIMKFNLLPTIEKIVGGLNRVRDFFDGVKDRAVAIIVSLLERFDLLDRFQAVSDFFIDFKDQFIERFMALKEMLFGLLKKLDPRGWFKDTEKEKKEKADAEARLKAKRDADRDAELRRKREIADNKAAERENIDAFLTSSTANSIEPVVPKSSPELTSISENSDKTATALNGVSSGVSEMVRKQDQVISVLMDANSKKPITNISIGGSGVGGSGNAARDSSAYDAAYEVRTRYWTSYTRGF